MQNLETWWLHNYMAENGISNVCVVPLEKIVRGGEPPDPRVICGKRQLKRQKGDGYNGSGPCIYANTINAFPGVKRLCPTPTTCTQTHQGVADHNMGLKYRRSTSITTVTTIVGYMHWQNSSPLQHTLIEATLTRLPQSQPLSYA